MAKIAMEFSRGEAPTGDEDALITGIRRELQQLGYDRDMPIEKVDIRHCIGDWPPCQVALAHGRPLIREDQR